MNGLFYKAAGAILAPFRYAEREVQHMKAVAKEDLEALLATIIKFALMGLVALLFLMFVSIGVAEAINQSTGSEYLGHLIVAGFYMLVGVGLYIWKLATDKKKEADKKEHETDALRKTIVHRKPVHA